MLSDVCCFQDQTIEDGILLLVTSSLVLCTGVKIRLYQCMSLVTV